METGYCTSTASKFQAMDHKPLKGNIPLPIQLPQCFQVSSSNVVGEDTALKNQNSLPKGGVGSLTAQKARPVRTKRRASTVRTPSLVLRSSSTHVLTTSVLTIPQPSVIVDATVTGSACGRRTQKVTFDAKGGSRSCIALYLEVCDRLYARAGVWTSRCVRLRCRHTVTFTFTVNFTTLR